MRATRNAWQDGLFQAPVKFPKVSSKQYNKQQLFPAQGIYYLSGPKGFAFFDLWSGQPIDILQSTDGLPLTAQAAERGRDCLCDGEHFIWIKPDNRMELFKLQPFPMAVSPTKTRGKKLDDTCNGNVCFITVLNNETNSNSTTVQ